MKQKAIGRKLELILNYQTDYIKITLSRLHYHIIRPGTYSQRDIFK